MSYQVVDLETFFKYRKNECNFNSIENIFDGYNYKVIMSISNDGTNDYFFLLEYLPDFYFYFINPRYKYDWVYDFGVEKSLEANVSGYIGCIAKVLYSFDIEEGFIPVCEKKQIINEFVPYDPVDLYDSDVEDDDGNIIEPGITNVTVYKGRMGRYEDLEYTIKLLVRKISNEKQTAEDEEYIKNLKLTEEDIDKLLYMQNELYKENKE